MQGRPGRQWPPGFHPAHAALAASLVLSPSFPRCPRLQSSWGAPRPAARQTPWLAPGCWESLPMGSACGCRPASMPSCSPWRGRCPQSERACRAACGRGPLSCPPALAGRAWQRRADETSAALSARPCRELWRLLRPAISPLGITVDSEVPPPAEGDAADFADARSASSSSRAGGSAGGGSQGGEAEGEPAAAKLAGDARMLLDPSGGQKAGEAAEMVASQLTDALRVSVVGGGPPSVHAGRGGSRAPAVRSRLDAPHVCPLVPCPLPSRRSCSPPPLPSWCACTITRR